MHGFGFGNFGMLGWIGMIINLVITLGVIVGIVWLVVWAVKRATPTSGQGRVVPFAAGGNSHLAREILQTRYARGEITRDEYLQMLKDLEEKIS